MRYSQIATYPPLRRTRCNVALSVLIRQTFTDCTSASFHFLPRYARLHSKDIAPCAVRSRTIKLRDSNPTSLCRGPASIGLPTFGAVFLNRTGDPRHDTAGHRATYRMCEGRTSHPSIPRHLARPVARRGTLSQCPGVPFTTEFHFRQSD